ncbi:MAG: ABC transporter ATP-binding protein [Oscillospiraceae bacterium]|nr:ABC transporter ATP-binding protein [Oscillospiraceae bacterium]
MKLQIEALSYAYGGKNAVENVNLHVEQGEFVGVIGPNGSGKSTILKNVYRALTPKQGKVLLEAQPISTMSHRETALKMAVVGQENDVPFDFTVEEIVAMGRSPHKRLFDPDTDHDRQIVRHALEHMGMETMAKRNYRHLSGGERQRVLIARAIAQESDLLILDEPTNHLDVGCQMQIFDFIKRLKVTVLSAIHDLNMAALYCDRLYVMKQGQICMSGTPEEVLTASNIFDVYGVRCTAEKHPQTGKIHITYLPA